MAVRVINALQSGLVEQPSKRYTGLVLNPNLSDGG